MNRALVFALLIASAGCASVEDAAVSFVHTAANRQAVLTALGNVDPDMYAGWDGDCPGTDVDLANAKVFFPKMGSVPVAILWNEKATGFRMIAAWTDAVKMLDTVSGGTLDIYFSGHGGQVKDKDGDEEDGLDETLCLWDGQLVDDLVGDWLSTVPATIQINFWTDCCNSGSNYRPAFSVQKIMRARQTRGERPIVCKVAHIGGCRDGKVSFGGPGGGELSNAVWKSLRPGITWNQLRDACDRIMPPQQVPVVEFINMTGNERVY